MPVLLKDFLKMEQRKPEPASCGHVLDVIDKEGRYKIDGNQVCQACYFECLGSEIEKHPIWRPTSSFDCV